MRILNLDQFCKEPNGTVYSIFNGGFAEGKIYVKTGYYEWNGKPTFNGVVCLTPSLEKEMYDEIYSGEPSETVSYYTECFSTDIAECDYNKDTLFAVFSKEEIRRMIDVLTWALCDGKCKLNSDDDNSICC